LSYSFLIGHYSSPLTLRIIRESAEQKYYILSRLKI
jgi:hypothetical protein